MNSAHRFALAWWPAVALFLFTPAPPTFAQVPSAATSGTALYRSIRAFDLAGGSVRVENLALKRDRAEMTFNGTFYFAAPVNGHVTGAVFLGQGTFRAEVPPSRFEWDNVRRLIGSDVVESDFRKTPIAQRSGMQDLTWFFYQWVYETYLPSYRLEYRLEPQADGSFIVRGTVFQEGIPDDEQWFMPLPVVFNFGGNKKGRSVVYAQGPQAPFALKLPAKPDSVELDPDWWVLSEKTSTKLAKGK